jgi:hypothetical protein
MADSWKVSRKRYRIVGVQIFLFLKKKIQDSGCPDFPFPQEKDSG